MNWFLYIHVVLLTVEATSSTSLGDLFTQQRDLLHRVRTAYSDSILILGAIREAKDDHGKQVLTEKITALESLSPDIDRALAHNGDDWFTSVSHGAAAWKILSRSTIALQSAFETGPRIKKIYTQPLRELRLRIDQLVIDRETLESEWAPLIIKTIPSGLVADARSLVEGLDKLAMQSVKASEFLLQEVVARRTNSPGDLDIRYEVEAMLDAFREVQTDTRRALMDLESQSLGLGLLDIVEFARKLADQSLEVIQLMANALTNLMKNQEDLSQKIQANVNEWKRLTLRAGEMNDQLQRIFADITGERPTAEPVGTGTTVEPTLVKSEKPEARTTSPSSAQSETSTTSTTTTITTTTTATTSAETTPIPAVTRAEQTTANIHGHAHSVLLPPSVVSISQQLVTQVDGLTEIAHAIYGSAHTATGSLPVGEPRQVYAEFLFDTSGMVQYMEEFRVRTYGMLAYAQSLPQLAVPIQMVPIPHP